MKVSYKTEIHRRKGKKNEIKFKLSWKNKKSDKWSQRHIEYCCDGMKNGVAEGFISTEVSNRLFINNKNKFKIDDERFKEPVVCLYSLNENGYGDEGCPHEEMVLPITHCPFCSAIIEIINVEKKRITHTCKKVKRQYEECEDQIKEEILS